MKTKTMSIYLFSILLACLFMGSASAAMQTVRDSTGDVLDDLAMELVDPDTAKYDVDNVDLTKVTYEKNGNTMDLTMEVNGLIDNQGSLDQFLAYDTGDVDPFSLNLDLVAYLFTINTLTLAGETSTYVILYVNEQCDITSESITGETINITENSCESSSDTLSISFDLLTTTESLDAVTAGTTAIKMDFSQLQDILEGGGDIDDLDDLDVYSYSDILDTLTVEIQGPYTVNTGESLTVSATVDGGTVPYSWSWDFGDDETSTSETPSHTYGEEGEYTLAVTVEDADGRSGTDTARVTVTDNGNGGDGDDEGTSNLLLFGAIILVITIAGVAVIIYIIRR